ncbi:MAG: CoA transferase [Alphaproteobacteria bacterium]|nr:CoA transferase [Alphaproteobacteria bacterium]
MPVNHEPERPGPLHGVRVVDLTRLLPGPFCTWYLSALGAEVIRVDPPGGGDYSRELPPVVEGHGVFFAAINRGKRSVVLDTRSDEGRALLHKLLETADVLVEGFKPGRLAAAGLDPAALRARHPKLVIASISGYGQTGPYAHEPGHDLNYLGLAGVVAAAGPGAPYPVQVADLAGGALTASTAICAALVEVARGGEGRWLDISMAEGALGLMAPHLATAAAEGRDLQPGGELLSGGYGAYRTYAARDGGLLTVAPLEPKFQARMAAALGLPVLDPDPAAMAALFATRDRDDWVRLLQGCCVDAALTASEIAAHPQHQARGAFERVLGVLMPKAPFPWAPEPHVARLGEHTQAILATLNED